MQVRGQVCRVKARDTIPGTYAIGVEWLDGPLPIEDLVADLPAGTQREASEGVERRGSPRWMSPGHADLEFAVSNSVTVIDISASGFLCSAAIPLPAGTRGHLRMPVGGVNFTGDIEVRRVNRPQTPGTGWRLGAMFGVLEEQSQQGLQTLLGRKIGT